MRKTLFNAVAIVERAEVSLSSTWSKQREVEFLRVWEEGRVS